jgi:REP element-mobilizing transposase RayT
MRTGAAPTRSGPAKQEDDGMRTARITETTSAYYHVTSRVVDRRMALDDNEKRIFHGLMRAAEAFCGVQVVTYAILDNHFHILLHVPERQAVDDATFLARLEFLYARSTVGGIRRRLARLREAGRDAEAEALKARYTYRMHDLPEYMKTLKQRFTQGFNRRHGRKGTLWEERYGSVLVEPDAMAVTAKARLITALAAVAAYIDLNPVRAGIVDDPKEYRFCGYGEAAAGGRRAREGVDRVMRSMGADGDGAARAYRRLLYLVGEQAGTGGDGRPARRGFSPQAVQEVLDRGGRLTAAEALRCRVRYFTHGAVLGSRAFVEDVFRRHRGHFGARRTTGARPMAGADWGGLCTARRLRLDPITPPRAG